MEQGLGCEVDEFDDLLLRVIDETLRFALGKINTRIVFDYLEKKSCTFSEIPRKLPIFSGALRELVGSGRGQILGAAPILERVIAEIFCLRLGMEFDKGEGIVLVDCIEKMKEAYRKKEVTRLERQ
jgi:hypothetical protein